MWKNPNPNKKSDPERQREEIGKEESKQLSSIKNEPSELSGQGMSFFFF